VLILRLTERPRLTHLQKSSAKIEAQQSVRAQAQIVGSRRKVFGSEGLRLSEDEALLSRHGNLLPVQQNKEKALGVEHPHLLYAAEIDHTIAPGAKERGGIQPALTLPERPANQGRGVVEVDPRVISAGFKHRNIRGTHHPAVHVVTKENEVVVLKDPTTVLGDLFAFETLQVVIRGRDRLTMGAVGKSLERNGRCRRGKPLLEMVEYHGPFFDTN
jgi:hypothetical protein